MAFVSMVGGDRSKVPTPADHYDRES